MPTRIRLSRQDAAWLMEIRAERILKRFSGGRQEVAAFLDCGRTPTLKSLTPSGCALPLARLALPPQYSWASAESKYPWRQRF